MEQDQIMTDSSDCLSLSNLPPNIISKIVQKLPVSYRKNFALTCKDFYKIVCHEDRFKYKMFICKHEDMLYDVYESIMASERVFDEIRLLTPFSDENALDLLTRIAAKHGSTIKKLTLGFRTPHKTAKVKASQFQAFLKEFPNLEEFKYIGIWEIDGEPDEPVLRNVKVLGPSMWSPSEEEKHKIFMNQITKFMHRNTLESCFIGVKVPQSYEKIFERQRNVKKIYFCNGSESSTVFKHLKIESIKFDNANEDVFNQIICNHAQTLKEIKAGKVKSRYLDIICNRCPNLESLWLTVTDENVTCLMQMSRLKKLNELKLRYSDSFKEVSSFNDVAKLKMMSIKKLSLNYIPTNVQLLEEILDNIGKNWPNIEEFSMCPSFLPLSRVVQKFKKLEVLNYRGYYIYDGHVHPGVKKLTISNCMSSTYYFSSHIMYALPNLKSLYVSYSHYLGASQLKALNDMKRLKELHIGFHIDFDLVLHPEDIDELKKLMHRLEDCEIEFHAPNNFIDELAERLKGEVFKIFDSGDTKSLYIKIKY